MTLQVSLLGPVRIENAGGDAVEPGGIVGELLGILLVTGDHRFSRDSLVDSLWPLSDSARSRQNLNTTLWRLRRLIEPEGARGTYIRSLRDGYVTFNRDADYVCDVEQMEAILARVRSRPAAEITGQELDQLRDGATLYRGELLEGVMSEWVLPHRSRMEREYQECLVKLLHGTRARGLHDESVHWAERILEQDPLREDVHRALIEVYDSLGRRGSAVQQYDRVRQILRDELNTAPSTETEELYYRVIEQRPAAATGAGTVPRPQPPAEPGVDAVLTALADVQRQLAAGLTLLADFLADRR